MLKKIIALVFAGLTFNTYACDICGCSAGNNTLGILPGFRSNFIGFRYSYRSFSSKPHEVGNTPMPASAEQFQTSEIWAKYMPTNRWQMFAFIPYNVYQRTENNKLTKLDGLGDISLLTNYIFVNTGDSSKRIWKHALQAGVGVKLPTGHHTLLVDSLMVNPNLQPGTGACDIMLNAMYTLRYKKAGFHSELSINRPFCNDQDFKFGNRYAMNLKYFYLKKTPEFTLLPQLGVGYETSDPNEQSKEVQMYTATKSLLLLAGIDFYYKKLAVGINFKNPLIENNSGGYVTTKKRVGAHILFLF